ncbi:MAG: hypothetical protein ABI675_11360 [Chitinophagaceae bacterium]
MKKISIAVLLFFVVLSSCKKDKPAGNYHVSFTVNGVNKTYTGFAVVHKETVSGSTTLTILGGNSASSFDDYMGIYIDNSPTGADITAGQYEDNSATFTVLTTYANGGTDYESGQSVAEDGIFYNVPIANHFKVNISSMDANTAKGTFSGDYYADGDVQTGTKLTITNGDFYVKTQ